MRKSHTPAKSPSKSSAKYNILSPELVQLNTEYTFTVNPELTPYQTKRKGEKCLVLPPFINSIIKSLAKLRFCEYELRHEISCHGKWHYHGIIKIKDVINFYCFDIPLIKEIGCFEIDTILDKDKWKIYLTKLEGVLRPYMEKLKLPYIINGNTKYVPEDPLVKLELEKDFEEHLFDDINNKFFKPSYILPDCPL